MDSADRDNLPADTPNDIDPLLTPLAPRPRRDRTPLQSRPVRSATAPGAATSSVPVSADPHAPNGHAPPEDPALPQPLPQQEPPAEPDDTPLPEVAPAANLARVSPSWKWTAAIFALTLLLYLAFVPRFILFSSPPTGDQAFYLMITSSLAEDRDINIANNYAQRDFDKFYGLAPRPEGYVGIDAPYPLYPALAQSKARPPDEQYASHHVPGFPLLLLPWWIAGSWFELWWPATVVFMCLIGALVAVNIFLLAYEATGRLWIALAVWLPMAFSNPVFSYSFMLFTELTAGLLLIYAFRRMSLGWGSNNRIRLLLVGLCIAYIPWLAWRTVLIAIPLLIYALVQWWRHARSKTDGREPTAEGTLTEGADRAEQEQRPLRWKERLGLRRIAWGNVLSLGRVLVPVAVSGVLLVSLHLFLFGTFLPPNRVPERGDVSPFHWPWQGVEELTRFVTTSFALLLDRRMGLITYAPILILSVVGLIAMFRSKRRSATGANPDRRLMVAIVLLAVPYMGMIASFEFWNGLWCPPARYQTTLVPLLAAPLAMSLAICRSFVYKGLYALLAIPGFIFTYIVVQDARWMWPGNSLAGWFLEGTGTPFRGDFALASWIEGIFPAFSPVDEVRMPAATGWMTATSVLIVLVSYVLMARRRPRPLVTRKVSPAVQTLLWLGAIGAVAGAWLVVNWEFIKPRTLLSEVHRWNINPPMVQGDNIAYHNGSIYLTDFRGLMVGRLNMNIGQYQPLQLTDSSGQVYLYGRPADIKLGRDGNLYLLNNGEGPDAMLVIDPEGRLLSRIPLNHKTTNSEGLSFAPDGSMYVADMIGGRIWHYPPGGGEPYGAITPPGSIFNNVKGVTVAPDGAIYAAELGPGRVHRFNPDRTYDRGYDVGCQPYYIAVSTATPDWAEVSCSDKLLSINVKSGEVRYVVTENGPLPERPSGLTYAPDGRLFLLENNSVIIAYRVTH